MSIKIPGTMGSGPYTSIKNKLAYTKWTDMMHRCYDVDFHAADQYVGVVVSPEWHDFQVFAAWVESQPFFGCKGYDLDKDILGRGLRIYSSTTCCLVPREINMVVMSKMTKTNDLPVGVTVHKVGQKTTLYAARFSRAGKQVRLGLFHDVDAARTAYVEAKQTRIRELAEQHKDGLRPDVYAVLKGWTYAE